jgi:hypothetical protein
MNVPQTLEAWTSALSPTADADSWELRLYVAGQGDQIVAIPTLVRKLPEPMRKIIGDLSNTERTLVGLDVRPRA